MLMFAATIAVAPFYAQAARVGVDDAHAAPIATQSSTAEPAAMGEVKTMVVVQHAVTLRDQPKTSTGSAVTEADTHVAVEGHVQNGEGNWSYVSANGVGTGWVQESEMAR